MPQPLPVSVVIPAFNRPAMVTRAVRSALAQRPRPPAEVIVVDDGSSDGTGAAASAAGATVIRHDPGRGGAAARNTGVRAAGHDWIAFLDSDDEYLPEHLNTLWPLRNGHVILGASAIVCASDPAEDSLIGRAGRTPEVLERPASVLRYGNALITSSVLARKDAVIAAGLFTEGMVRSADLELWLRVLEQGTGYVSPVVTVRYHLHAGQVTEDLAKTYDAYEAIVDAFGGLSRSERAGVEARLQWDRLRLRGRTATLTGLWSIVRDPYKARSLIGLLGHRYRLRRRRLRYTRSGAPTIRVWTSSPELVAAAHGRGLPTLSRGFWAGLPAVLLRPAGLTVTDGGVRALTARLGGSKAVRVRPGAADALDTLPGPS